MPYKLEFSHKSLEDLKRIKKDEPALIPKVERLLGELAEHPTTGTGKPEKLKGDKNGRQKHRLVYEINSDTVVVFTFSAWGHYEDK